jgi:hypothetical protein
MLLRKAVVKIVKYKWIFEWLDIFRKILQYQIKWKSVYPFSSCFKDTDIRTDGQWSDFNRRFAGLRVCLKLYPKMYKNMPYCIASCSTFMYSFLAVTVSFYNLVSCKVLRLPVSVFAAFFVLFVSLRQTVRLHWRRIRVFQGVYN